MARLLIQNSFPMLAASPQACSSRSLAAPALPPPAPPSHWRRDRIPPTLSARSAASSKRKSLRKSGKQRTRIRRPIRESQKLKTKNQKMETANSFIAQRDHGIDAHSPLRRDPALQRRDAHQEKHYTQKRCRVGGSHVEQHTCEESRKCRRGSNTQGDTESYQDHRLPQKKRKNFPLLRA